MLLFAPTEFLALRSALAWLVVPTLTWRFLADNPYHWAPGCRQRGADAGRSAAYVEALIRWRDAATPQTARGMRATLATGLAVTILLGPYYLLASSATAMIPDAAVLAASNRLALHLTDRATVTPLDPRELPNVDWIAEDSADDDAFPLTPAQRDQLIVAARTTVCASCWTAKATSSCTDRPISSRE